MTEYLNYLYSYNFLTIVLIVFFITIVIAPFYKRYCYCIFLIEQYLTFLYENMGECEFFGEAVDNIVSPWKIAFRYNYDEITLAHCVYDQKFLENTVETAKRLQANKENKSES